MEPTHYLENLDRLKGLLELSTELFERAKQIVAERAFPHVKVTRWILEPEQRLVLIVATLLLATSAAKAVIWVAGKPFFHMDEQVRNLLLSDVAIYITEAILLVFVATYVVKKGGRDETALDNRALSRGLRAENRFFGYWPYLWLSWFALYVLLAYNSFNPLPPAFLDVIANFLNNLSGLFIFAMFFELTEKTDDRSSQGGKQMWIPMLMLLILLAAGEGLLSTHVQAGAQAGIRYIFGLLSGLLVGVTTALFVARLTSRLFDFPVWVLAALSLFAVIQPVFPVLTAQNMPYHEPIGYVIAFVALYAKIALLIALEWMRDRYTVLYYLVNVARLFDDERERHMSETFKQVMTGFLDDQPDPPKPPRTPKAPKMQPHEQDRLHIVK